MVRLVGNVKNAVFGMLRRVALDRTDVSEERIASIIIITRIDEIGTTYILFLRSILQLLLSVNVVPISLIIFNLMIEAIRSSQTSILTTVTRFNVPEDDILNSYRRENHKSYIAITGWTL
jgi:hypothetical protein